MNVIETTNLHKIYNSTQVPVNAVDGIDLTIEKGEFTAIVGPSGCGKTTLLNMIGGLDDPTKGRVTINKVALNTLNQSKLIDFRLHNIGFVFQAYNLIPVLTVKENIGFIMQLQGRGKNECNARIDEMLEAIGLPDKKDQRPNKLSGGQQQRVAVARALASKPQFILADEPTANLDSKATNELLELMEKLNREENMTFIFSTHDDRVMKKARRLISLDDGKVISDVTV
ncbi:MAG: macrolide ABC transporter ATP-binding protein [Bacteroidetes bacterium 4572_114]|nr:MAG: macrolide ABC transporter ATP-binding protein [Bacteroidetes bacterium 4572_114]